MSASKVTITRRHTGRYHIGINDADMGVLTAIVVKMGGRMMEDLLKSDGEPQEFKDSVRRVVTAFKRFESTLENP